MKSRNLYIYSSRGIQLIYSVDSVFEYGVDVTVHSANTSITHIFRMKHLARSYWRKSIFIGTTSTRPELLI